MRAYTREFCIGAYVYRFIAEGYDVPEDLIRNAEKLYDKVGKDRFRVYASVTAEVAASYKRALEREGDIFYKSESKSKE